MREIGFVPLDITARLEDLQHVLCDLGPVGGGERADKQTQMYEIEGPVIFRREGLHGVERMEAHIWG